MLLQLAAQFVDLFLHVAWMGASLVPTPTLIVTQMPTPQVSVPAGSSWDPAIVAAIITSIVSVVAVVYQIWHARKIEREKDEQQRRHEQEMEHYRRELDLQYREKEQEEQREEASILSPLLQLS